MIEIRDALFEDAVHVAYNMREADRVELLAAGGDPVAVLLEGWETSDWCNAAIVDGVPSVIWGVRGCAEGLGSPWLLATDNIKHIKKTFLLNCKPDIDRMQERYERLFNYVHINNDIAQRWLSWLGFEIHTNPTGNGEQFYLFTKGAF